DWPAPAKKPTSQESLRKEKQTPELFLAPVSASTHLRQPVVLRLVAAVFLAPALHGIVDELMAELGREHRPVIARIFLRVKPAEKLRVGVGVRTQVILRADRNRLQGQAERARFVLHPAQV